MTYRPRRIFDRFSSSASSRPALLSVLLILSWLTAIFPARADDQSYQAAFNPATSEQQRDMDTVKKRLIDTWLTWLPLDRAKDAAAKMRPDGSFPNIDYVTVPNLNFPAADHVKRVQIMALAYANPGSPLYKNPDLKAKISKGLDYWYSKDPKTNHHWFMTMGLPLDLVEVLILCEHDLSPAQLSQGLRMIERGYSNGRYLYENQPATGQNLVWTARAQFMAGCVQNNYAFALNAVRAIQAGIKVSRGEGVQPDDSFLQHGPLIYSAGYGAAYATDNLDLLNLTRETSFAPAPDQIQLLVRLLLDGDQWMMRGYAWDFSLTGRGIVGYAPTPGNNKDLAKALQTVAAVAPERAAEAKAMAQRITAPAPAPGSGPKGNRDFWCADYMTQSRPDYFLGIRTISKRTHGTESGNHANLEGYYLGTGVTCLMKTGKEYDNIFQLWNWRQLPGTTCAQSNAPYPDITWGGHTEGTTVFVGGASDGVYGATGFDFQRDGIAAHKGWFCFDDEVVCLGAGITATVADPVDTTLEQNWHSGTVAAGKPGGPIAISPAEPTDLSGAAWLLHGTTGYIFPTAQNVKVLAGKRTSHPHDCFADVPADKTLTGDVFRAWIEHGVKPSDASYSYVILPNTDADMIAAYQPPQIVANSAQQQVVWHPGLKLAEAILYTAGSFTIPSGPAVNADQPCVLLARFADGAWQVTAADPTETKKEVNVTVDQTPTAFALPQGLEAGKSVTKTVPGSAPTGAR